MDSTSSKTYAILTLLDHRDKKYCKGYVGMTHFTQQDNLILLYEC